MSIPPESVFPSFRGMPPRVSSLKDFFITLTTVATGSDWTSRNELWYPLELRKDKSERRKKAEQNCTNDVDKKVESQHTARDV
ncbi:hypothetical protein QL285_078594 [Trifolium repens]|nr:hypothetical protein QL285_078594 [Trifolium repens]